MSASIRYEMTAAEFLEWEAGQELRYEFDGFAPVAMTGGTAAHAAIGRNLFLAIGGRLRGKPCDFYGADLKVETAPDGKYRYPDGFVTCVPVPPDSTVVREPVVIFEVLSASTADEDRYVKNREYSLMPSVRRYVLLEQTRIAATMFERVGEDWVGHVLFADSVLRMPEIGVEVPMEEFYEGVGFADTTL